jgi:hypothetical protein
MGYEVKTGEIAIVLRPIVEDDGWSGAIQTGLIFGQEGDGDGQRAALDLALTMAVSQRFLDENPEAEDLWDEYRCELLQEMFPEQWAESEAEIEAQEQAAKEAYGNVITLNAWTKTKGNA